MRNKWYVAGMGVPALAAAVLALWCMVKLNWLGAIVPALAAAGLFRGAWWAWHADSFGPVDRKYTGDMGTSVAVARWNKHRAEREAAASAAKRSEPAAGTAHQK